MTATFHGTTILCVKRGDSVVMGGDGQITLGEQVVKSSANKIRRLYRNRVLAGFAGASADALTLFERFEQKLETCQGQLERAAVALTKDWRTDRFLRRLEAMLIIADGGDQLILSGAGDVLRPEGGVAAIGSGSGFAESAARALVENTDLPARAVTEKSLKIASKICIYTNDQITMEELHG